MKRLMMVGAALMVAGMVHANNVTDTLTSGQSPTAGDILWYSGVSGNTAGTWSQPSSIPGIQGAKGDTGATGATGATGSAGVNGADGAKGDKGDKGSTGAQGAAGKDAARVPAIDPRVDVEVREYDARHWALSSFASFGFQSGTSRYVVGQKLTLKLGKSHEERLIDAQAKKIAHLERLLSAL